ncbi:MAG: hypothetical protein ACXVY9_05215 [Terriglobales bacterium]
MLSFRTHWQLLAAVVALVASLGCHRADIHQTLKQNLRPAEGAPIVLAVYEPWFGDNDHMDVGYSSHDRVVLSRQIDQAQNLGISSFVVDWYGPRKEFLDASYALLQQTAAQKNFKVALMYDEPEDSPDFTAAAMSALDYAYEHYIGPKAEGRSAYLTYDGRPVIFLWPRSKQTDWRQVRQHVQGWEANPILIMEDGGMRFADVLDGFYAWVQPGDHGWSADGSNWGRQYLESFYKKMREKYPNKLAVGAAWPGFNDRKASWSLNRYMDPRCGKTFEESLRLWRRYYTSSDPLPFLLVVTWNDYEEGTAIERGLNCREPGNSRAATAAANSISE